MSKKFTWLERNACLVLSYLKYKDDGYYKCRFNDMILNIARVLLGGRDPIDYMCIVLELDEEEEDAAGLFLLR